MDSDEGMVTVSEDEIIQELDPADPTKIIEVTRRIKKRKFNTASSSQQPTKKTNTPLENPSNKVLYCNNSEAPFQVIVESKDPKVNIGRTDLKWLNQLFKSFIKDKEYLTIKNKNQLLLEFSTAQKANEFVLHADLSQINSEAYIPNSFVELIGIIRQVPIGSSDAELLANIRCDDQDVKINKIRRFMKKEVNGEFTQLETCAVHFQSDSLPTGVFLFGNMHFRVSPYRKSPIRCNKCAHFGHVEQYCKSSAKICTFCAEQHDVSMCEKKKTEDKPRCALCNGEHEVNSKVCPKFRAATKKVKQNPFPNRFSRNSIKEPVKSQSVPKRNPPLTLNDFPPTRNRFSIFTEDEEEQTQAEEPREEASSVPFTDSENKKKSSSNNGGKPGTKASNSKTYSSATKNSSLRQFFNSPASGGQQLQQQQQQGAARDRSSFWLNGDRRRTRIPTQRHNEDNYDEVKNLIGVTLGSILNTALKDLIQTIMKMIPKLIAEAIAQINLPGSSSNGYQ